MQQFNLYEESVTLSNRWTVWLKRFQYIVVTMDIKYATRKRSLLLHLCGPNVAKMFETVQDNGEKKNYDAMTLL